MKNLLLLMTLYTLTQASSPMEQLYLQNACNSCHGIYGEGMGSAPRLQYKSEKVLLQRLRDLQKGKTRSPFGTVMISFAKALTPTQTKQMAKYLSTLKTVISEDQYDEEYDPAGDGGS